MVSVQFHENIAIIKLERGVTNSLDMQLVQEFGSLLQSTGENPNVRGLVLTSANDKFFSIGFDIPHLFDLPKEEFITFYQAFNRFCLALFTFPKPTVAAITGHAIAGGCILALCCDYRYIAAGRKLMGLNEIKLGVPIPYPADCILRQLVGLRHTRGITDEGKFYQPEESLQIGMVDQVLPLEQVLPVAIDKAVTLGGLPAEAFALIKHNRVDGVVAQIQARLEEKEQLFVSRWYSNDARERLRAAMEKF
ncbi:MAG: enoyl-CoA hydratase/isomerase family protein [Anaerolineales bacterium]|nr:enoyl-CoA hydratase/isomerase family protein [Anaerolineales bacterium]